MKKIKFITGLIPIALLLSGSTIAQKVIDKTFDVKDLKIDLVLGSCKITKSSDTRIHVHLEYSYSDNEFEARFEEKTRYIDIEEKFYGDNHHGYSRWTVRVPNGVDIDIESATGSLSIEDVDLELEGSSGTGDIELNKTRGEVEVSTGTGSVEILNSKGEFDASSGTGRVIVENSEGEFDVSSGTGKVNIEDSKGNFEASSGTGKVEATKITIEDEGEFSCGTGDVEVFSPSGNDFDLEVSSGTNDAVLIMGGKPLEGYFEFECHARRGDIISPVKFDKEEDYWEGDNHYLRKSFTKGKGTPRYYIHTGTGRATLKR
jgi:hypothetical protein